MKYIKLISTILVFCMIMLIGISTISYAAEESFELQLEPKSSTLNPGDTFSVDIVIDNMNITSGDQGIGAYQAKIVYDSNALELVSVTAANGWERFLNEGNIVINTDDGEVVKERTTTSTINFKVKDDAEIGETTISLENIKGSSGTTTIDGTGISATINIEEKTTEPPTGEDNTTGGGNTTGGNNTTGGGNTTGGNNTTGSGNTTGGNSTTGGTNATRNNTVITPNNNQSTTANKNLPYTGARNIIIVAIIIAIISMVIFYIKYKRAL